jgi:hypothetical protein
MYFHFFMLFLVFPLQIKAKRQINAIYRVLLMEVIMRQKRELAENVWYEMATAINIGEPLFQLSRAVMLFSSMMLFCRRAVSHISSNTLTSSGTGLGGAVWGDRYKSKILPGETRFARMDNEALKMDNIGFGHCASSSFHFSLSTNNFLFPEGAWLNPNSGRRGK